MEIKFHLWSYTYATCFSLCLGRAGSRTIDEKAFTFTVLCHFGKLIQGGVNEVCSLIRHSKQRIKMKEILSDTPPLVLGHICSWF